MVFLLVLPISRAGPKPLILNIIANQNLLSRKIKGNLDNEKSSLGDKTLREPFSS